MTNFNELTFVKKAPKPTSAARGKSPIEKAREKLLAEIDTQIELARDPSFILRKERKKRDGTREMIERKPRSWVVVQDDEAYITARFSNKPMPLGGKRGSIVRCAADEVPPTLQTIREYVASGEADQLIDKMLKESRRKNRT